MREYKPGTPSWVDLASPDLDASARFYNGLFGWEVEDTGPVEQTGGYRMFTLGGEVVAGLGPIQGQGQPPAWMTYVTVADADETAAKARAAGAQLLMEPFDVLEAGRMAVLMDPVGAVFSVWEPRQHSGAQLTREPGTLCWNELTTREPDRAKEFYTAVFGWQPKDNPMGEMTYTEWDLDGEAIGGMIKMTDQWPPEVPSHWMVYFAVEDCDASTERARGLGGTVSVPPTDIEPGRFSLLSDPQGAFFSIVKLIDRP